MTASAMQLVQLNWYGECHGGNDKALTWRKNLLKKTLFFPTRSSQYTDVSVSNFFSRVSRSLSHAPSQVLTLVCSFSHAHSREIRKIPITS